MPTLEDLRTAVREKIDRVNAATPSDTELNRWINHSAAELWDLIVTTYEDQYTIIGTSTVDVSPNSIGIAGVGGIFGGTGTELLFKLRSLQVKDGDEWRALRAVSVAEMDQYDSTTANNAYPTAYVLIGSGVRMLPETSASVPAGSLRIVYIPSYVDLEDDEDSLFVLPNNWHEYVIVDAAIKARLKLEEDPSGEMQGKALLQQRITRAASNRTPGASRRIVSKATHRDEY